DRSAPPPKLYAGRRAAPKSRPRARPSGERAMRILGTFVGIVGFAASALADGPAKPAAKVAVGQPPPAFTVPAADGSKTLDLGDLLGKGPVLVRLTCACSGCDK